MLPYLILLFTVVPAVELALLIKVGTYIGVANTLTIIILTGVLGAYLARLQGFTILRAINERLANGEMPTQEMLDGCMVLCGGILLLTPGFVTDILGFLLLIPLTRLFIKLGIQKKLQGMLANGSIVTTHSPREKPFNDYEDADFH